MGSIFYQIWKIADKKSRKMIIIFLAIDVIVWNFVVVPLAATKGLVLPQVEMIHLISIMNAFGIDISAYGAELLP
ncbi:hypothetical protein SEA1_gp0026 [Salmonella phage SEA1]|uniref:dCTP pyrophosphatase n=1 Tax=Salmonella phage vB_SnwM_CGG4-1 TaxID=1815631 RepID=A0A1B0VV01_9CAUD|nr:dCTP pyrophosphatase [Salmonella phage vB_SnwM_CGG4-1]ANA49380.1 dCTP pyrophosphatase [Salmonella phage vB_SnwM_CGG4-1]WKV23374.1 hypothetical protein SEA1_gp0026 [Salmonella phage SEA1]